jgi:hypothetical protein
MRLFDSLKIRRALLACTHRHGLRRSTPVLTTRFDLSAPGGGMFDLMIRGGDPRGRRALRRRARRRDDRRDRHSRSAAGRLRQACDRRDRTHRHARRHRPARASPSPRNGAQWSTAEHYTSKFLDIFQHVPYRGGARGNIQEQAILLPSSGGVTSWPEN